MIYSKTFLVLTSYQVGDLLCVALAVSFLSSFLDLLWFPVQA